jgi:hypothetical protein
MTLVERLQRCAKELDKEVVRELPNGPYQQELRDLCDLLEEAIKALRESVECPISPTMN